MQKNSIYFGNTYLQIYKGYQTVDSPIFQLACKIKE